MPRYLVERTFPGGLNPLAGAGTEGARADTAVIGAQAQQGVTWVHSHVTPDRPRSYCICEGPSPQAIRLAARACGLPEDRITEVRVLDPSCLH